MHIQEGTNTTLTTCTKMTEEVDRRHGVNGTSSSSKVANDDVPVNSINATGGRLKFFKDGKFILELVRGSERSGWVSVPRKTFWPPAAPAPPAPLPPSASLSLSDDNSSLHSSPWQRDHCWKQATPRRNLSKELAMYYCRPATLSTAVIRDGSRLKRRRPHHVAPSDTSNSAFRRPTTNGICERKRNGDADPARGHDSVDGVASDTSQSSAEDDRRTDLDREKFYHMKLKKPYQYHKLRVYKKTRPAIKRKELNRTIDRLRERIAALPAPINAKLANCRQEHMMVSPRKRILREMERVSLEEHAGKRRARTAPPLASHAGPSHAPPPPRPVAPVSKNVSSYSIHSLLSMSDDSSARSSPLVQAPRVAESPASVTSPELSPSPPGWELTRYRSAPHYREAPYVYGYGYAPHLLRAPPLWLQYAAPPGPWPPLAHPLLTEHMPKDEPTSDLPLNLSKH